jgi:AmmeMemoRadiSam system protein A
MTSEDKSGALELSDSLKDEILNWSREVLAAELDRKTAPAPPAGLEGRQGGVFVTLKRGGKLRGCIGRFEFSSPLASAVKEMVLAAAFHDFRFPPIAKKELDDLELIISVLTEPKPLESLEDLVIGRDGLYLLHPRGRGVLLPVVAEEHGWTPLEFARNTARKAGLSLEAWKDPGARLLVFTAPAFSSGGSER